MNDQQAGDIIVMVYTGLLIWILATAALCHQVIAAWWKARKAADNGKPARIHCENCGSTAYDCQQSGIENPICCEIPDPAELPAALAYYRDLGPIRPPQAIAEDEIEMERRTR